MTPLRLAVTVALVASSVATKLPPLRTREPGQGLCYLPTSAKAIHTAENTLCPTNNGLDDYVKTKPLQERTPAYHHTGPADLSEAANRVFKLRQVDNK